MKSLRSSSAKTQTKSYALRLQARAFLLAAKEGIWLYQQSDGFSAERLRHWTWKDIEHPDRLHELSVVLGRGRGIGSRKATNPGDNQPVTSGEVIGRSLS